MNVSYFYLLFAFLFQAQLAQCKNILAVYAHFGKSHFYMYEPLLIKLAERGHSITLITWFKVPNIHKNIELIHFAEDAPIYRLNLEEYEKAPRFLSLFYELEMLNQWGQQSCSLCLSSPKIKNLIQSGRHYDLVLVEYFNTDCFAVFAHVFKAPLVGMFSSAAMPWHNDRLGNPDNPSYIPNLFTGFPTEMDFFSRVKNSLSLYFGKLYFKIFYNGPTDRIIKRNLGKGIPNINDIVQNTSLYLCNSHFSVFQPRPTVPAFVEVAGLHIQPPKSLPADLQKYFDNSKNGVVYFSLGTVTNGSSLPPKRRDAILAAFGKLPVNVLWKWESDDIPNKPKNVMIKKWVPQSDVLAHPNLKLFITHGGLMGTLEAVHNGVPMIMIPLFGDQFLNAASIMEKGAGIVLDYFSLTEQKFLKTINSVLEDKRYTDNAKLLAAKFKERPLSGMNNAIYWTEYILKFKGAPHLRPAVTKLSWFSEYLLDIALFTVAALFLSLHLTSKALAKFREMKKNTNEKKKKNN